MSETQEPLPEPEETPPPAPQEAPPEPPPAKEAGQHADPAVERRIASLTARLSSAARERDEFAARLSALEQYQRQQMPPQQPIDPQLQQAIDNRAAQISHADRMQERVRAFHEQGSAEYPDWKQR